MGILDACRARAFAALGSHAMLERFPGHDLSLEMIRASGACLMKTYESARRDGWDWFEPDLAYDNARLCEALLKAGRAPILLEPVYGSVSTKRPIASVNILDNSGQRTTKTVPVVGNKFQINGATDKTMYYEIVMK